MVFGFVIWLKVFRKSGKKTASTANAVIIATNPTLAETGGLPPVARSQPAAPGS
jgi:hypothetical protein